MNPPQFTKIRYNRDVQFYKISSLESQRAMHYLEIKKKRWIPAHTTYHTLSKAFNISSATTWDAPNMFLPQL